MSLYLKYRPRDFNNLVWQDFIKNTLLKSISENKTVWAYLFCWPRWTGKTSTARIFAKAINCENVKNWNPCNQCTLCNWINNANLVDVIEIDAASFTWIDNIRDIIEKAQFRPTHAKYKIYIIDEVHMLSKWAFNALLKILEEPPSYVKFILATTETNKVPETIISRCQRYDFKRINKNSLRARLEYVAKEENINIDGQSLEYIINTSAGWLRNALNLFEQLINDKQINFDYLSSVLWLISDDVLNIFLNKLIKKDNSVIDDLEEIINSWKDIKIFFQELIFKTKNIAIKKIRNSESIDIYIKILDILDDTYTKTKNSLNENTTFTIGILKILEWDNLNKRKDDIEIEKIIVQKNNTKDNTQVEKIKINEIKKDELVFEDIAEIFSNEENINKSNASEVKITNRNEIDFDKNLFIEKAKQNWISSWAKMSLIWALFRLDEENLTITSKTDFTKKSLDIPAVIIVLNRTLEDLWFNNKKIILK